MKICKEIDDYIKIVRSGKRAVCKEQLLLCDFVEKVFQNEDIRVDEEQLKRYMRLQKHFPYELLEWEEFCFTLHNCVYRADGELRFPFLLMLVGRGAGKNGYLAFEDFALATPINGVREYHIDMFATSEAQARTTFDDIYNVLEGNRDYFKNYFKWNLECIANLKTGSKIKYHTKAPGTKDGGRPGKVDFDEYHAYKDYKLIEVATGGLGKKRHPRRTVATTQGDERDGPLDELLDDALNILKGTIQDNGILPFICWLDDSAEVDDERMWYKANPSLHAFPHLLGEMRIEYQEYKKNPVTHTAFMTKRMNRPPGVTEWNVTEWDNLVAATREVPDLRGRSCVAGIDYANTNDFVVAGLLFKEGEERYWIYHIWVSKLSRNLENIKYPLKEDEAAGLLTFVDDAIAPEYVTEWLAQMGRDYIIEAVAIDLYRLILMGEALKGIGFTKEKKNVVTVRPSNIAMVAPIIEYIFTKQLIAWGTSKIMRWFTWNAVAKKDSKGNISYEKINKETRKTDGFMAYVAAETIEDKIKKRPKLGRRLATVC